MGCESFHVGFKLVQYVSKISENKLKFYVPHLLITVGNNYDSSLSVQISIELCIFTVNRRIGQEDNRSISPKRENL